MSKLPDISNCEGMGELLFFAFDIAPQTRIMKAHGVIFNSLVLPSDYQMKLATPEDDPRMGHFMRYVGQFQDERFNGRMADEIKKRGRELDEVLLKIKQAKARLEQLKP